MNITIITSRISIIIFFFLVLESFALNPDGTALLAFKYSILTDPLSVLKTWNYSDPNPCSWNGVLCSSGAGDSSVVTLSLPNSRLTGSIPPDLGFIPRLQHLDLSGNFFNGTLPQTLFNATSELKEVSFSSNLLSGDLPDFSNTTTFTVLDLSSNLFSGSLPGSLGGPTMRLLNFSHNKLSGGIPADLAGNAPENATIDLSFNNLTGPIPGSKVLSGQDPELFSGNQNLCGKPLKNACVIPSTLSAPPINVTSSISPAIAVIPNPDDVSGSNSSGGGPNSHTTRRLTPAGIVGITLADLAGVAILGAVFLYLYQLKKRKQNPNPNPNPDDKMGNYPAVKKGQVMSKDHFTFQMSSISKEDNFSAYMPTKCLSKCLRGEEGSKTMSSSDSEADYGRDKDTKLDTDGSNPNSVAGSLVMVDGETEVEVETLLKASAYVLGATGSSIVYKAVLENGSTFAVRRLGESWVEKLRDFEGHVKAIGKLKHPNLIRVRGFYSGSDEKLVIYDYVSNGSLATSAYKKNGSTPCHLPLLTRLKIARGVARGLTYIHEKRFVHGNIKPSNILLAPDMEPVISDLGLSWLVYGTNSCKGMSGSARLFGSKGSYDGAQELSVSGSPYICSPFSTGNGLGLSPYQAPESLKNLKPSSKWDVYSFGIVLLELLTGKVFFERELGQWTPGNGCGLEDRYWVLRVADVALRAEIQGKEEVMMSIFKLGFSCASLVPQKRPSMKEALQVLDKLPFTFDQSCTS